mgnify:CR=1 FL=1
MSGWRFRLKPVPALRVDLRGITPAALAGLSVAYHAKPKVREQAMVSIESGGLDRLLEVVRA